MNPEAAKRLRLLASTLTVLGLLAVIAAGWFYSRVRASLPLLDGTASVAGLAADVTVTRDALGVPTLKGQNRVDIARALGWLHAQDRFFQMDLLRRASAGELAAIVGDRALILDRARRKHGFRALATQVVARLTPPERAVLEAYTAGINAGLAALPAKPFEYYVLRDTPQPWRPEDTILVIYSMTLDLQRRVESGRYEQSLMTLRDQLGLESVAFFNPLVTPDDAALDGTTAPLPSIPGPRTLDLRTQKAGAHPNAPPRALVQRAPEERDAYPLFSRDPAAVTGSNAFALAGRHTASGAAMVANDMHFDLAVPNVFYRVSLEFEGRKITGVTLPGVPAMVAGSNGQVAWGFTASYADTADLVVVETQPGVPSWYNAPGHAEGLKIEQRKETIRVKGEDDVVVEYPWTVWGPIIGQDELKKPLALRWVAHDPAATNLRLLEMETAQNVTEAVAIAHRSGVPAFNLVVADRAGDVAWTIAGSLPKRVGFDGRLPVTWSFGDRKWDGLLPPDELPVLSTKAGDAALATGRIASANQRHAGGAALAKIGDGDYPRPNRAAQAQGDLATLTAAKPADLLAVQLDDRALFLAPWHKLLMDTLSPAVVGENKPREALRGFVEKWEGRASVEAVSYPLVRDFREAVYHRVFDPIFAGCVEAFPDFDWHFLQLEPAVWTLLREKPAHLLNSKFASWDALLVDAVDDVIAKVDKVGHTLPHANWGSRNIARIHHPFGNLLPAWASGWLNMPADPLPGDDDMPRVQRPTHGAMERFVVSPGREQEGIFHMPGGQSAHPLSPYFRAGHEAWVKGEPTPFLPGATVHTLILKPQ